MIRHRRVLLASLTGTTVEFYDFYIYATAASLVFGPLFFPGEDKWVQMLSSYAVFAVAFVARPVGAALFGHFGDRIGRKSTLVASLMLMGGSTVAIGCLPTYEQIGWWAPAILCVLRFGQGLGLGGEWGGASLLAVENAPKGWEMRYGMFPPLGAPVGFIAANGFFLVLGAVLDDRQFADWGWRLPFLTSAVLVLIGLWVRLKLTETPAFLEAEAQHAIPKVPIGELLRDHLRPVLAGTFCVVSTFAIFYLATAFAIGYGTGVQGHPKQIYLSVEMAAILFLALGVVVATTLSDWYGVRRVMTLGFAGCAIAGLTMAPGLGASSMVTVWLWLSFALFGMGFTYGPLGGFLPELFPAGVRYTAVSLVFSLGGIIGGGLAPMGAAALVKTGGLASVGLLLVVAATLSLIGMALIRPRAAAR
ncbi:MFS transporter [Sphingomonas immobilis]|uniref:MFS transporter n=1 Tax=Sphingomonas immobilis TaxID=3063997 RepID=A0ABT8ZYH9_9SPHN|nr:MFS transporter [Sphingomonas sp. CA1-15]MDO7842635.1 MFS transporter [Sphingomonas sp. CA1-15]